MYWKALNGTAAMLNKLTEDLRVELAKLGEICEVHQTDLAFYFGVVSVDCAFVFDLPPDNKLWKKHGRRSSQKNLYKPKKTNPFRTEIETILRACPSGADFATVVGYRPYQVDNGNLVMRSPGLKLASGGRVYFSTEGEYEPLAGIAERISDLDWEKIETVGKPDREPLDEGTTA